MKEREAEKRKAEIKCRIRKKISRRDKGEGDIYG